MAKRRPREPKIEADVGGDAAGALVLGLALGAGGLYAVGRLRDGAGLRLPSLDGILGRLRGVGAPAVPEIQLPAVPSPEPPVFNIFLPREERAGGGGGGLSADAFSEPPPRLTLTEAREEEPARVVLSPDVGGDRNPFRATFRPLEPVSRHGQRFLESDGGGPRVIAGGPTIPGLLAGGASAVANRLAGFGEEEIIEAARVAGRAGGEHVTDVAITAALTAGTGATATLEGAGREVRERLFGHPDRGLSDVLADHPATGPAVRWLDVQRRRAERLL